MGERDTGNREALRLAVERDFKEILEPELSRFEITEKLERLNALGIGRAFGHVDSEKEIRTFWGYIIPTNKELTQHVVIFVDGEVFVTEANGETNKLAYGHEMGPSSFSLNLNMSDIDQAKRSFMFGGVQKSKVVMRSSNPDELPKIQKKLDISLQVGMALKQAREEALKESPQMVLDTVDGFLSDQDRLQKPKFPELPASFDKDPEKGKVWDPDNIYDEPNQ